MVSSQEKIKIRFLLRRIGFLSILGAKPNAMKKTLQLLAAVAALLLPAVSCEDLFRPDKPAGPPEIYYTVPEACDHAGEEDVWVQGYIVGAATGSKKIVFGGPYAKNTNLVLAPSDTTTIREHCLAVQLPAGALRDALNLMDHPDLSGREIYIKGDLVDAYFGIRGLKSPSEYWMDSGSSPE